MVCAVLHNAATHHFQKLAHHVMALLEKLERHRQPTQQVVNAVYFLRLFVKHLTENLSAAQLVTFVSGEQPANGSAGSHAATMPTGLTQRLLCSDTEDLPEPVCFALALCSCAEIARPSEMQ